MKLTISPLTAEQVSAFLRWEYPAPYATYNLSAESEDEEVRFFLNPDNGYFGITAEDGSFLGFCNFGADARVPGGDYAEEAVDVGMGMRPDLTGQGKGSLYATAVFDFARRQYPGQRQRVTIASFNKRAQQLCKGLGFEQTSRFTREQDGRPFVIMVRDLTD